MLELTFALLFFSFAAGFLMFFAPCTFPLIPAFLVAISGRESTSRRLLITNAFAFCLGFSLVFIILGLAVGLITSLLPLLQNVFSKISGLLIIIFALIFLRVIPLQVFGTKSSLPIMTHIKPGTFFSSAFMGAAFSFGWSPCVGPILATILLAASTQGSELTGLLLLIIFSLGHALPFIITAIFFSRVSGSWQAFSNYTPKLEKVTGLLLLSLGLLIFIDGFASMTYLFTIIFNKLGLNFIFDYL